jgi:hypothetical protein
LIAGKPDYVFWRGNNLRGDVGVIELKRSGQPIIGSYSSQIIYPSSHVSIARQQTSQYLESIQRGEFLNKDDFFIAGNRRHAFIIIGNSLEIIKKCQTEVKKHQFKQLLPPGFHLYTYSEVFDLFVASSGPRIQILIAENPIIAEGTVERICNYCEKTIHVPADLIREFHVWAEPIHGDGYYIEQFGGLYCNSLCFHRYTQD